MELQCPVCCRGGLELGAACCRGVGVGWNWGQPVVGVWGLELGAACCKGGLELGAACCRGVGVGWNCSSQSVVGVGWNWGQPVVGVGWNWGQPVVGV